MAAATQPDATSVTPAQREPLDRSVPVIGSSVSTHEVGVAIEQQRVFVQFVPSHLADVVGKPLHHITEATGTVNDAGGHQALYNAIVNAQGVAARTVSHVEAKNLLFVFSECAQTLGYALFELPPGAQLVQLGPQHAPDVNDQQGNGTQPNQCDDRAVLLCQCGQIEELKRTGIGKQQEASNGGQCYHVTGLELERIKRQFDEVGQHATTVAQQGGAA